MPQMVTSHSLIIMTVVWRHYPSGNQRTEVTLFCQILLSTHLEVTAAWRKDTIVGTLCCHCRYCCKFVSKLLLLWWWCSYSWQFLLLVKLWQLALFFCCGCVMLFIVVVAVVVVEANVGFSFVWNDNLNLVGRTCCVSMILTILLVCS